MKRFFVVLCLLAFSMSTVYAENQCSSKIAQRGCCSHHGGVCGCSGGAVICCDGSESPSCRCKADQFKNEQLKEKMINGKKINGFKS